MKALIQRVQSASVTVGDETVGAIGQGLLVLLGVEKGDDEQSVANLVDKLLHFRVFADADDKMNLSVSDISGQLLVVSQFTLAASTRKGLRPSFSSAAEPEIARRLYELCVNSLRESSVDIRTGRFAANMQVSLVNDGPVTFLLEG